MKKTNAMTLADIKSGAIKTIVHSLKTLSKLGMKTLTALFFLVIATTASAQKSAVLDAFSKHAIDVSILNADNLQQPNDFAYDFRQTTITAGKQTTTIAKFDPSGPKEEQWTVVSVDGKSPSKSDINSFRKNHSKQPASNQTDESSYKIEKETSDHLVISYKSNPGPADKDAAFMKDCRLYMTVNLKTRKLEKVQAINEKPLKIKILNAEKFDLVIKYNWNDQGKRYFPASEELNILAKFIGQAVTVQTISEYSNYAKR